MEKLVDLYPEASITVLDRMTYAADFENISHLLDRTKRTLVVGNVTDLDLCSRLTRDVDCVIHMAAESHVDNSFGNSIEFTLSNTLGTHTLLEAARVNRTPLFIHVSTDEVYGEVVEGRSREEDALDPSNPYSASKAGAEMMVRSYQYSFSMPIITARGNNIFGIRQFPEKIIPKFTMQLLCGQSLTVHGSGENSRHYLAAEDFADALMVLMRDGKVGEIYNIGSDHERTNLEVARMVCDIVGADFDNVASFVDDRPFNDRRYSIDCTKIRSLGWAPQRDLPTLLPGIVRWYQDNQHRYRHLFLAET
tara:strand:- start:4698 stop:5618 length:921 start_codon:yes stop_codon:yes gene_type:complete